jgi:CheY-like chemotaxis protein
MRRRFGWIRRHIPLVQPQVLIADDRLSYIDGLQLCRLLRDDALTTSIRIVGITADSSPEHVRLFRQHGADAVLVKPVSHAELASAVRMPAGLPGGAGAAADAGPSTGSAFRGRTSPRHQAKARLHERYVSTNPPEPPPHLRCPKCDGVLQYDRSHIGGVSDRQPEQWDYFVCVRHGTFQYRHRTRKLKPAS